MIVALAFLRRDAKIALSYPGSFWMPWISIIISVVGFYFVSKLVTPTQALGVHGKVTTYFSYVVINVSFSVLLSTALLSFAGVVRRDQNAGTLEAILVYAPNLPYIIFCSGLWTLAIAGLQVLVYLGAGRLLGLDLQHVNLGTLALFMLLSMGCMSSLGMMAAAAVIAYKQTPPSGFLVGGAASMLAGVMFPVSLMPLPLQAVSWCLPLTHALAGMRGAMTGTGVSELSGDALWLLAVTIALIPVSVFVLQRSIDHAKLDGTLAGY
ncbi:MAG: ABC transporter permease [Candidatus Velthaea sp.]